MREAARSKGLGTLALIVPLATAGTFPRAQERVVRLAELQLTLTLPPLEGLAGAGTNRWRGRLGPSLVEIALKTLPGDTYRLEEPEDVLDSGPSFWSDPGQERNDPSVRRSLSGPFGFATYASWERSELRPRAGGAPIGVRFLLAGLLPQSGYWITLEASPPPTAEGEAQLLDFLAKGIVYDGPVREHRWTDAEAFERWKEHAPASTLEKFEEPLRTAHYIVLTNSSGGPSFAKKMEECHDAIREVFPFEDVRGRRLMPVFLFRTSDEYYDFYSSISGIPREDAERSKGHAWRDYYATWYDAPGDPVHIHEATHQIFANRLGLGGGGSWFQEGVAEYMSSKRGDRSAAATQVKKGRHVPLSEFVVIPSLLNSTDEDAATGDRSGEHYDQAALLIEFLRESKWAKDEFPLFLSRVGRIARGDGAAIEAAIGEIYGVDLAGLEQKWVEYCKKR